ncbi:MAG: hypothetical protein HZC25_05185 [Rhodospirillales bacterium]|nr:hypothetical protein [Rhodospirillales bacterium]
MTPEQLLKIGVPLSKAWTHFGDPAKCEELEHLKKQASWEYGVLAFLEYINTRDQKKADEYGEIAARARQLKADLHRAFFQGIFCGRGHVPPSGVGAVGNWPVGRDRKSLAAAGQLSTAVVIVKLR